MLTIKKLIAPLAALVGLTAVAFEAQATPAFARQMDMNCMGCHSQSIPMLNAFGRQFKLSGYTMTGGNKSMITGGDLGMSMPTAINAGIGIKTTHVSNDKTGTTDELNLPKGSAIFIGGKIADGAGANVMINNVGVIHLQTNFSKAIGGGHAGVSINGTAEHGPFIGVESHNTGLHKELAMFDGGKTNAIQGMGVGLGKGPATGLTAFYGGHGLKAAVGTWALGFNSVLQDKSGLPADSLGSLYRLTYDVPAFAGWSLSVGAFGASGTTTGTSADLFEAVPYDWSGKPWGGDVLDHKVAANGFDLQVQGMIAGMDTQILLSNVGNYEFTLSDAATGTTRMAKDLAATSVEFQIMPVSALGIRLGYMAKDDKNDDRQDSKTIAYGINYNYADNVRFSLERATIDVDTEFGTNVDYSETLLQALIAF